MRRLVKELNIDASKDQRRQRQERRILKSDVMAFLDQQGSTRRGPSATVPVANVAATDVRQERRVPMTRLRARIAERLVEASRTPPS